MTREHSTREACAAFDALLAERAAGPLEPADESVVSTHLAACPRCATAYAAYVEVLDLARLPPPAAAPALAARRRPGREGRDLGLRALHAWNVRRRRRVAAWALSGGVAAAAALTLLVFAPALRRAPAAAPAAPQTAASWDLAADAAPEVIAAVDSLDEAYGADGLDDTLDVEDDALAGGVALLADDAGALP